MDVPMQISERIRKFDRVNSKEKKYSETHPVVKFWESFLRWRWMGFVFGPLYGVLIYLYITHLFLNGAPFTSDEDLNPQEQDSPPKSCKNINYLTQRDLTESGDYNYLLVYLNVTLMSKETSHYIGAGIGGSVGLGLTLASPWSPTTRCSSLLMIPSLLTKRGRDFMLTFVTGLVLTGPVNTFQYNFQEIVRSFTCMYCQVKDLAGTTSIRNIIDRMRKTFADVMFLIKLIGKWWSKLLYMSVIYVIIDALDYQRGYYIDDDFDNMMVDDNLRRKWKVEGEARLTPMRNWELKDRYQKTTSLWISKTERRKMIKQSFPTIIVTIIVVAIVIGDWVLTAILTTLAKTAGTLTSKVCLPRGLKTPSEAYGVIFTMLFVCLLSCAIDAYSTRIRPLVCHIFFPERAKERANYLYKKIQGGRRTRHYQLPLVLTRELDKRERQKEKAIAIFPSSVKKILFAFCPSWIIKNSDKLCLGCGEDLIEPSDFRMRYRGETYLAQICSNCKLDS